jgi:hypothetical protein
LQSGQDGVQQKEIGAKDEKVAGQQVFPEKNEFLL